MPKKPTHQSHLLLNGQSIGRCGKSLVMQAVIHLAKRNSIPVAAIDLDEDHRTLSHWFPKVTMFPLREPENIGSLIREIDSSLPLTLLDCPAQASQLILDGLQRSQGREYFAANGIRPVVFGFMSSETPAIQTLGGFVKYFGVDGANYILVDNPKRFSSTQFRESKLYAALKNKAAEITLPTITDDSIAALQALSHQEGRLLTISEAVTHPVMQSDWTARVELSHFLNSTLIQLEAAASHLLPDPNAITDPVPVESVPERINVTGSLLDEF